MRVLADAAAVAEAAAALFAEAVAGAIAARGRAFVSLAGGSTPKAAYALLGDPSRGSVPWADATLVLGDERAVPRDHPESNARMIEATLLRNLPPSARRLLGWETDAEGGPEEVATRMAAALRAAFGSGADEIPRFDLVLLGLGADGHTASLFPGSPALTERRRLAVANPVPPPVGLRYTLTFPVLEAARRAVFLVSGRGKAETVRRVLEAGADSALPASRPVALDGETTWLLDEAAASRLRA